jgi:hypothetical protein
MDMYISVFVCTLSKTSTRVCHISSLIEKNPVCSALSVDCAVSKWFGQTLCICMCVCMYVCI